MTSTENNVKPHNINELIVNLALSNYQNINIQKAILNIKAYIQTNINLPNLLNLYNKLLLTINILDNYKKRRYITDENIYVKHYINIQGIYSIIIFKLENYNIQLFHDIEYRIEQCLEDVNKIIIDVTKLKNNLQTEGHNINKIYKQILRLQPYIKELIERYYEILYQY
jgi:molybdopterin/thiamine biosynthesis adenylyltransferase